jgi:hypothetical protein
MITIRPSGSGAIFVMAPGVARTGAKLSSRVVAARAIPVAKQLKSAIKTGNSFVILRLYMVCLLELLVWIKLKQGITCKIVAGERFLSDQGINPVTTDAGFLARGALPTYDSMSGNLPRVAGIDTTCGIIKCRLSQSF